MRRLLSRRSAPPVFSPEHLAACRSRPHDPAGRPLIPSRKVAAVAKKAQAASEAFEFERAQQLWELAATLEPAAADAYVALATLGVRELQSLELLAHSAANLGVLVPSSEQQPQLLFAPLLHVTVPVSTPDDARLAWAKQLLRHGKLDECAMWLAAASPLSVNAACLQARLAFEQGDNDQALRRLQQITVEMFADDVQLLSAAALSRMGLLGPAQEKLQLLAEHPSAQYRLAARYQLAYVHEQLDEPDLARLELERVYAERADYADVGVRLGVADADERAHSDDPFDALAREIMSDRVADDPLLGDNR